MPQLDDFDDDDEDWYDEGDDPDDDDCVRCPTCGKDIPSIADRCPACGYWLSEHDRRGSRSGDAKPAWIKATASVVLVAMLAGLLSALLALF